MLVALPTIELPLACPNIESLKWREYSVLGIITTNRIDKVILLIGAGGSVLTPHAHIIGEGELTSIIDHEAATWGDWCFALKTSHHQKLIIWNVNCLEVVWNFVLRQWFIVNEWQSFKVTHLFEVVEAVWQVVSIEYNQGHWKIWIIWYFAYTVNLFNFWLHRLKRR